MIFLLWLLQWWLNEEVPGMGIVKSLLHLLLIPSLILLPISLIMRRRWLALVLLPSVVAFFISFGIFFLPRTREAPAALPTFRLMTFNIQSPDEVSAETLVEILRAADADIVALQELTPLAVAVLEERLRDAYPHQALHPYSDYSGQGVLSRYPITADEFWRYQELPAALGHQRVELEIADGSVVLYNVHVAPPLTLEEYFNAVPHRKVLERLLDRVAGEVGPVLLAGDFNMTDHFHGYRILVGRSRFTDAFRAVGEIGFGFTFPHKDAYRKDLLLPAFLRLDYIFYDASFRGIRAQVWPNTNAADHAPVVADLALSAPTGANMGANTEEERR